MLEKILKDMLETRQLHTRLSKRAHILDKQIIGMSSIMLAHAKSGDYTALKRVQDSCNKLVDARMELETDISLCKKDL